MYSILFVLILVFLAACDPTNCDKDCVEDETSPTPAHVDGAWVVCNREDTDTKGVYKYVPFLEHMDVVAGKRQVYPVNQGAQGPSPGFRSRRLQLRNRRKLSASTKFIEGGVPHRNSASGKSKIETSQPGVKWRFVSGARNSRSSVPALGSAALGHRYVQFVPSRHLSGEPQQCQRQPACDLSYTASWIGVQFPEGTRYDLGLTELLFLIPLAALFYLLGRRPRSVGFFFVLYTTLYGVFRVWQDTLHIQPPSFAQGRYGDMIGGAILCAAG